MAAGCVSGAAHLIGQEIAPRVTSNVQTSVGRMLFASLDPEVPADPQVVPAE